VCMQHMNDQQLTKNKKKRKFQRYVRKIPRCALLDPQASPWEKLYVSKNDAALIVFCGFDHESFLKLEIMFTPYFESCTPWSNEQGVKLRQLNPSEKKTGRPRKINARSCLALALSWYRHKGADFVLQGWFGLTGTALNGWLHFSRLIIIKILSNDPSKVQFPNDEKIKIYKEIIHRRHENLTTVYCAGDGLKLPIQAPSDRLLQSEFYNGWTHGHYIGNLFLFAPDGLIIACVINMPGSIHDSTMCDWGKIYNLLNDTFIRTNGQCCMDSAFALTGNPGIIRSSEEFTRAQSHKELLVNQEATSLRQYAEWGMGAIQSAFPKMTTKMKYEEMGTRKVILLVMVMLYNFRCYNVGINQIRSVYVPEWDKAFDEYF
jgi:DDE superfamily endonuclease